MSRDTLVPRLRSELRLARIRADARRDSGLPDDGELSRAALLADVLTALGPDTCIWTEDHDGIWWASCPSKVAWVSEAGGTPTEHRMAYCYGCGRPLEWRPVPKEADID